MTDFDFSASPPDHLGSVDDRELVLAFQKGEDDSYQAIYDRYSRRVAGVCTRLLRNSHDAQEASQETFLKVFQALGRFNGRYQLGPWITRIATNVCLDQIRSQGRRPTDVVPIEVLEKEYLVDAAGSDPEVAVFRDYESRRVTRKLRDMPPLHRAAIVLRDFEGLSYEEIGIALSLTESQVKALLHRARKAFRRSWASLFLPGVSLERLAHRVRRLGAAGQDQTAQVAATTGSSTSAQVLSSCSAVIQQCGSLVGERVATALVAGTVALGVAMGGTATPVQTEEKQKVALARPASDDYRRDRDEGRERPRVRASRSSAVTEEMPTPVPSSTAEEEQPAATDEAKDPDQTADPGGPGAPDNGEPPQTPEPSQPAPEPDMFSLGFQIDTPVETICSCFRTTAVNLESVVGTAGTHSWRQEIEGVVTAGETPSYGLEMEHSGGSQYHQMRWSMTTNEGVYRYTSAGTLQAVGTNAWEGSVYTYAGTFKLGSRPTKSELVPEQGTYVATVAVSSRQTKVLEVWVELTTNSQ